DGLAGLALERAADGVVDERHDRLDGGLQLAGSAGREALRDLAEQEAEHESEHDRPRHRVDVQRPEIAFANARLLSAVPDPLTLDPAHLQVREMVLDVFAGGFSVPGCVL